MNGIGSLDKEVIQKIEMPPGSSLFLSVNVPFFFSLSLMLVIVVSLPLFVPFQSFFVFYQRFCKAYNNCFFIRKCFASLYKKTILQKYFQSYTRNKKYCFYSTFICKWSKIVLLTKIRSKIKLHTKITFFLQLIIPAWKSWSEARLQVWMRSVGRCSLTSFPQVSLYLT